MKRIFSFYCLLVFCVIGLTAQNSNIKPLRESVSVGLGFGINRYITSWSFNYTDKSGNSVKVNTAHKFPRQGIFFDFEVRSLFTNKRLHVDFGFNTFYGIAGKKAENTITNNNQVVSKNGNSYGFGIFYKFTIPFLLSSDKLLTPFTGFFVQGVFLTSDVITISNNIDSIYNYAKGWNEGIIGASIPIGLELEMDKVVFFTEFSFMFLGVSFTDWNPIGSNVREVSKPVMNNFILGILYKL
ncbi:hypothetical protein K8R61_01615 [bacterium]|nr:hypothetical protein [bacterium]